MGMFTRHDPELIIGVLWKAKQRSVTPAYREMLHKLATRFDGLASMLGGK